MKAAAILVVCAAVLAGHSARLEAGALAELETASAAPSSGFWADGSLAAAPAPALRSKAPGAASTRAHAPKKGIGGFSSEVVLCALGIIGGIIAIAAGAVLPGLGAAILFAALLIFVG